MYNQRLSWFFNHHFIITFFTLNIAIKNSSLNESTIIWAVTCSILLHILFFGVVPNFKFDVAKKTPDQLTVEIVNPKPPEPLTIPEPSKPVKPKPVEPEHVEKIQLTPESIKPAPKKELKPKPAPVPNINPEPTQAERLPLDLPAPPNVIAAEPKLDAPQSITAPPPPPLSSPLSPPEAPKKNEPSQNDINAALSQYSSTLGRAISQHKDYPNIAKMRGWQGNCSLDLKLDGSGNVLSASVKESSGYDVLDNQALEMARKAAPFPAPPEVLRDRNFNLTVPVSFKLE